MTPPDKIKYPKIPYFERNKDILSGNVEVYEKLDGGNCQILSGNHRLFLATRSGDHSNRSREHEWFGHFESWANRFYAHYQHELGAMLSELLPERLVLFGEWLSPHSIQYAPENMNQFYLIDVYDRETDRFLPYRDGAELATTGGLLPLNTLRTLAHGKMTVDSLERLLHGSDYYAGNKEGVVVKDYANQRFAKLLSPRYREYVREKGGLYAYLTPHRLEKIALKIKNIGKEPLNSTTLRTAFLDDLEKEAQSLLINPKEVDAWLSPRMDVVLRRYKSMSTRSLP